MVERLMYVQHSVRNKVKRLNSEFTTKKMKSSSKLGNQMKLCYEKPRDIVTKRYCVTQWRDPPLELDSQLTYDILGDQSAIVQANIKKENKKKYMRHQLRVEQVLPGRSGSHLGEQNIKGSK